MSICAHFYLNDPNRRENAIKTIKEVDYLTNKIYKIEDNANDSFNQKVCKVAQEFLKENNEKYLVPEYFNLLND